MAVGQVHDGVDFGPGDDDEVTGLVPVVAVVILPSLHQEVGQKPSLVGIQVLPTNL